MNASKNSPRWRLEEIDWQAIDRTLVRDNEFLFTMLACASFVEILAALYSRNLIDHFRDNPAAADWLEHHWQAEEIQHGQALKAYVQAVWPEFDWDATHAGFSAEYGALCTMEQLEAKPALEMVARCVVETGTSSFYRALHDYVREPILRQILANIKRDEASHYAQFRRYFTAYDTLERQGLRAVLGATWRRVREARGEDAYIAFKHVQLGRHPGQPFREEDWHRFGRNVKAHARHYYPYGMALTMLLQLVPMKDRMKRIVRRVSMGMVRVYSKMG